MNSIQEDRPKLQNYFGIVLLAAIPVVLCAFLYRFFDPRNLDSGFGVIGYGLLLTWVVCPLYSMILCNFHTKKKRLPIRNCITICLLMNALTCWTFIVVLAMITSWDFSLILWGLLPFIFSTMVLGIYALIKYRQMK